MAREASHDQVYRVISTAVDAAFYRTVYPDVAAAGVDPILHYDAEGWREGRDPAPWFSTRGYFAANPDVERADQNPLHHYLAAGRREGREIAASRHAVAYRAQRAQERVVPAWGFDPGRRPGPTLPGLSADILSSPASRAAVAAEFDAVFYLSLNSDVAEAGIDPLDHFLNLGWREGREPSADFSVADYLEMNPDVAQAGVNPLVHFALAGRAEGRSRKQNLGFRYQTLSKLQPVAERIARAKRAGEALSVDSPERLTAALSRSRSGLRDLHITLSHDDYSANVGGVQFCLQREGAGIAALGRDHLHLFPAVPWPTVRRAGQRAPMGALWNGERIGTFAGEAIAEALGQALAGVATGRRSLAIHSLLGHSSTEVLDILAAAEIEAGLFWLHDSASLCAGVHLMRNDVADCGAPPPQSPACSICIYGPYRQQQVAEHGRLFEALDLTVVAPSESALGFWGERTALRPSAAIVHPHAALAERGGAPQPANDAPLRVAFLGMPAAHKGWLAFRDVAQRFAGDPRYVFLHLATATDRGAPIEFHPVAVTQADPGAMRTALERLSVDVAVIWSLCRETFSFTAYETAAAGAMVLTNPDSGNVAAFVQSGSHGLVLPDEAALADLFATGEILELARARRSARLYDMIYSGLSADLLHEAPDA
jgi:hypothetical protein